MDFVKRKLIIIISAVFLITVDNIYADLILISVGVEKLKNAGYNALNDGLQNYLDREFSDHFNGGKTVDEFEQSIVLDAYNNCLTNQWEKTGKHEEHVATYYRCYLLIFARELPNKIDNVQEWCKKNVSAEETESKTVEIKADGFKFSYGIDNYAYALWLKEKGKYNELKESTKNYVEYLETEGKKNFGVLKNITKWCQIFNIEIELNEAGFTDRYSGLNNYRTTVETMYNNDCEDALLNQNSKIYCNNLKSWSLKVAMLSEELDIPPEKITDISHSYGTLAWCNNFVDEILEGPKRITECKEYLEKYEYDVSNSGWTNYVKPTFAGFVGSKSTEELLTTVIVNHYNSCLNNQWTIDDTKFGPIGLYYLCYLLVYTRLLPTTLKPVDKWCVEDFCIGAPEDQTSSLFTKCKTDITADELDFEMGIDSYAQLKQFEENQKSNNLNETTQAYVSYLNAEAPNNNDLLKNTTNWCMNFGCDMELYKSELGARYDGLNNYEVVVAKYKSNCDYLYGRAKQYCIDLLTLNQSSDQGGTAIKYPGTNAWCEQNKSNATSTSNDKASSNATS